MNFRERLEQSRERLGNSSEGDELEENFRCEFFAIDNFRSLPACLDLRLPDNRRKAIPYSYFTEMDFNTDYIEITTANKKIRINGRDLGKLYDYLVAYRVRYIMASSGTDLNEEGLFVKEILIEEI